MARISRKCTDSNYFHIMVQGYNKEFVFNEIASKEKMKELIFHKLKDLSVKVIAYCIMDNHFHLLIKTESVADMSKYMARINSSFAKFYNKVNNKVGYVFRDRYRGEAIYNINYLMNCIKYIHENPVKAKMVMKAEDYAYSSMNDYKNHNIDESIVVEVFGDEIDYLDKISGIYEDYNFIEDDNEFGNMKIEKFEDVCKEFLNYDFKNDENVYKVSNYLKKRCKASNEEIYKFMGLKRSSYYSIIKRAKKLDF